MTVELIDVQTGEVVEAMTADEAERITHRIALKINTLADTHEAVMPMIRDAITRRADQALGYASVGAYVSDRFGDALSRLGVELRREVVRELEAAEMSNRAIARVFGVTEGTVRNDLKAGAQNYAPEPEPAWDAAVDAMAEARKIIVDNPPTEPEPTKKVVGIDGKTYKARSPKAEPSQPRRRRPLQDAARDAGWDLRKSVERLQRIAADDRFTANKDQMAPHLRSHLTHAVEVCQDLLDRINN